MSERLIFAIFLIALGCAGWLIFNRVSVRRLAGRTPTDPLLRGLRPGAPAIVYFTTPFCDPCRTQQMPALARLQNELGEAIQIVQVDAVEQPEDADRWGVFSAPTTFVLDGAHRPRHVNRGVASADMLKRQLEAVR